MMKSFVNIPVSGVVVRSSNNVQFKRLKGILRSTKMQRANGLAIIEGVRMAEAAIMANATIEKWIISENVITDKRFAHFLELIRYKCRFDLLDPDRVLILDRALFLLISNLKTPEGILGIFRPPVLHLPSSLENNAIILDRLQDAGNTGSILRTAAAVGVRHVIALSGNAKLWSSKVMRAAMGAHFYLHLYEDISFDEVINIIKIPCFVTTAEKISCRSGKLSPSSLFLSDVKCDAVWVFGNEGSGVSSEWYKHADQLINVPQSLYVESLNVASSVAVCLFEQKRQRLTN